MTTVSSAKYFMFLCLSVLLFYIYVISTSESNTPSTAPDMYDFNIKYLLFWTPRSKHSPFTPMLEGSGEFLKNNCKYTNCYVTANRSFLKSINDFDALLFHGKELSEASRSGKTITLPQSRSPRQKYIFATVESAQNYPMCDEIYDGYFNWTWTYRLDSDVRWGYLTVLDLEGRVMGPKVDMSWRQLDETISDDVREQLKKKNKAVAWFVSHCQTRSFRELYSLDLKEKLKTLDLDLDIYGACVGSKRCPKSQPQACNRKLKLYYFYLAFENSFSMDYVTEKVLNAMDNYAVPIVFGDANYTRFLPPGSYVNAREMSAEQVADTISKSMSNTTQYEEFFRWRRFYRIIETTSTLDVCNLCAAMNNARKFMSESVYRYFREWWNIKDQKCPDRRTLIWKNTFT